MPWDWRWAKEGPGGFDNFIYKTWGHRRDSQSRHDSDEAPPEGTVMVYGWFVRISGGAGEAGAGGGEDPDELLAEHAQDYVNNIFQLLQYFPAGAEFVVLVTFNTRGQQWPTNYSDRILRWMHKFRTGRCVRGCCKHITVFVEIPDCWHCCEGADGAVYDLWARVEQDGGVERRVFVLMNEMNPLIAGVPLTEVPDIALDCAQGTIWPRDDDGARYMGYGAIKGRRHINGALRALQQTKRVQKPGRQLRPVMAHFDTTDEYTKERVMQFIFSTNRDPRAPRLQLQGTTKCYDREKRGYIWHAEEWLWDASGMLLREDERKGLLAFFRLREDPCPVLQVCKEYQLLSKTKENKKGANRTVLRQHACENAALETAGWPSCCGVAMEFNDARCKGPEYGPSVDDGGDPSGKWVELDMGEQALIGEERKLIWAFLRHRAFTTHCLVDRQNGYVCAPHAVGYIEAYTKHRFEAGALGDKGAHMRQLLRVIGIVCGPVLQTHFNGRFGLSKDETEDYCRITAVQDFINNHDSRKEYRDQWQEQVIIEADYVPYCRGTDFLCTDPVPAGMDADNTDARATESDDEGYEGSDEGAAPLGTTPAGAHKRPRPPGAPSPARMTPKVPSPAAPPAFDADADVFYFERPDSAPSAQTAPSPDIRADDDEAELFKPPTDSDDEIVTGAGAVPQDATLEGASPDLNATLLLVEEPGAAPAPAPVAAGRSGSSYGDTIDT